MPRHRHQEFIRFLKRIEAVVPAGKLVHATLDNYAIQKHPKVRAWLARHPRWTCPPRADPNRIIEKVKRGYQVSASSH